MNSALYEGWMTHERYEPAHAFRRRLSLAYLDLDEVDEVLEQHPLWSTRRWAPVQFRRTDYLQPSGMPLADAVRDLVEARTGARPTGSIRVLTQLRTMWWLFNPISLYYCFDGDNRPETLVAEVTNTPWHERHPYVLPFDEARDGGHVPKALHVSPFMVMDRTYRFRVTEPGRTAFVAIDCLDGDDVELATSLALRRRALTRLAMGEYLRRQGMQTVRVSGRIYREAAALLRKGAPVHQHPARSIQRTLPHDCGAGARAPGTTSGQDLASTTW